MKKSLFVVIALIMVFALVLSACGGQATEAPVEESPAEEAAEDKDE